VQLRGVSKGANTVIGGGEWTVVLNNAPAEAMDLLIFQLDIRGQVRFDDDLVFYNQPTSPEGAVRLSGSRSVSVDLGLVPASVATVAVAVALSEDKPGTLMDFHGMGVTVQDDATEYWLPSDLTTERAAVLAELYRRNDGWKLRNVSAGWDQGLSALVRHHGVSVDDESTPAAIPAISDAPPSSASFVPPPPAKDAATGSAAGVGTTVGNGSRRLRASNESAPADLPAPNFRPANGSRRSIGAHDESTPAAAPTRRVKKPIAWIGAAVVALIVLVGIFGTSRDRDAPVVTANAGTVQAAAKSGTAASTFDSASTLNSARPTTSPTRPTAAQPAEVPLAAPPAVLAVRDRGSAQSTVVALRHLPVKVRAPRTGYSRAQFGQTWTDNVSVAAGHNGCDTRNDVLRRDVQHRTIRPGSHGCVVASGSFADPYTGQTLLLAGATRSTVQIDHVVSLSNAWQSGAGLLTAEQRQDLANDPANLQTTASAVNEAKGDGDAATWLPPNKAYRCTYVARQVSVKTKYRLWVTPAEREAISRVLVTCGATPAAPVARPTRIPTRSTSLPTTRSAVPPATTGRAVIPAPPTSAAPTPTAETPTPTPETTTTPTPIPPPAPTTKSSETTTESSETSTEQAPDVYYANCTAARAAGAAPMNRGDPGYRPGLDRDDDGIACET